MRGRTRVSLLAVYVSVPLRLPASRLLTLRGSVPSKVNAAVEPAR